MRPVARNTDFGVPDQVRHKPSRPATGMVRYQEFHINKVEGLYYLHVCACSENKAADQL